MQQALRISRRALKRHHSSGIQPARLSIEALNRASRSQNSRLLSSLLAQDLLVTRHRFSFAVWLVGCLLLVATANAVAMPSITEVEPSPAIQHTTSLMQLAQTQPAQPPAAVPSPAQPAADDEPIGNVATLTGSATVTRNNAATPLKLQDDIFQNDVLQTSANSTLGVTFNDATTFNLTANARITIDNYVYEDGGKQNAALFDVVKGTVAFAAAAVAKTGDMKISTPTATLGIRGTTGLVEVPEGTTATSANNVAIKLYPDADGKVGRIEVNGRDGSRLGFLTQGASGFAIRPGVMGRITASPLAISPQQSLRDQGIVRQVHAAQTVGRQIVTQQRALRQANPNRNNQRNNPARQPGPQRQNSLPQRPGSPQQPGQPNRPELQRQDLQRQGGQPGAPVTPGVRPGAPGVQQATPGAPGVQRPGSPGFQNRPALQRRPAGPAPKGKPQKQKR
jgi:FecR protein